MIERAIVWAVGRVAGGPGRAWLLTAIALRGFRMVRSATGRRPVVDVGTLKPGQRLVIEHRTISHGKQIKQFKAEAKAAKKEAKAARKEAKAATKAEKAAKRQRKAATRAVERARDGDGGASVARRLRRRSGSQPGRLGA